MACTHRQRDMAALLCFATASGVKLSSSVCFFSARITLSGTLSLSKSSRRLMRCTSERIFLAVSQSAFSCSKVQTPSMVFCTSGGGFGKDLISVMSCLFSAPKASMAVCIAGMASSRSVCASSFMAWVSAAKRLTSTSSAITCSITLVACSWSRDTSSRRFLVMRVFSLSTGCKELSSTCMVSTIWLVSLNFCSPFSSRSLAWVT
mmetsp:Transcript_21117/g.29249  ORF Transcript_21117/g.29249 Transcript_21117/m.29249 type:complete len:205 (-) Transcript_21117:11-625(-)